MIVGSDRYPKLRPLDIRPHVQNNQPYLLLRDPLQLGEGALLAPQPLASALAFCDGQHTPTAMVSAFERQFGLPITLDLVEQLLAALDDACLLENERAAQAHQDVLDSYRSAPFRPPLIAGQGYPGEAGNLRPFLDSLINEASQGGGRARRDDDSSARGLLSPHIDYARGGSVYAQLWQAVAEEARASELVILLGTDHYGIDPFTLTRQNYATPYGILPTDQAAVDALVGVIGEQEAFAGELRHRGEHSLELVAVWLHHMRGGAPVDLVPVLVGSFQPYVLNGSAPTHDFLIQRVVETLREQMRGRRTLIVASGDLAHVGPAFSGDPLDEAARHQIHTSDRELVEQMEAGDADGFFSAIKRVQDRNNVCGVSPIYLTMQALGRVQGEEVAYAVCPADETETSVVTISGVVFR